MRHQLPNILSFSRIVLTPVFFIMYTVDDPLIRLMSLVVYTVAALTDYFDGHYARKMGVETSLGVFLDPLADKILTFSAFIVLPTLNANVFPWWPIIAIVVRDVWVTGMRVVATKRGMEMKTSFSAKVKTFIQMGFLYVSLLLGLAISVPHFYGSIARQFFHSGVMTYALYVVAFITIYTGIEYIVQNRKLFPRR